MTIYDRVKFKCRTFIESINLLFTMGSELEQEVDTIETSVGTSEDEASSSGSLWARIKYALANMVAISGAQTIADVKTFSSSPVVPTTPETTTSAVNQAYVESTVDGVNNIAHKSGNEIIAGNKTYIGIVYNTLYGKIINRVVSSDSSTRTKWYKIATVNTSHTNRTIEINIVGSLNNFSHSYAKYLLFVNSTGTIIQTHTIYNKYTNSARKIQMCTSVDNNGELAIWLNEAQYTAFIVFAQKEYYGTAVYTIDTLIPPETTVYLESKPEVGDTFTRVDDPVLMADEVAI